MPICFPTPAPRRKPKSWVTLLLLSFSLTASTQMLAHPGWKGNGLNTAPWWQHAIFYQVDAPQSGATDFKSLTVRLDALRSLGIDALLVPAPDLPAPGSNGNMPNLDDFDALVRQASSREIRVLLTLQAPANANQLSGLARFWLNHGIAGFHLVTPAGMPSDQAEAMVESVRKLASSSAGQRIVLSDLDVATPASSGPETEHGKRRHIAAKASNQPAQLQIDMRLNELPAFDAAHLRPLLSQTIDQPNLLLDLRPPSSPGESQPSLARATAVVAMLTHPAALIDSGAKLVLQPTPEAEEEPSDQKSMPATPPQPPPGVYGPYVPYKPPPAPKHQVQKQSQPEDPLTAWYRQLAAIHHGNDALRSGRKTFIDMDSQNVLVWVIQPAATGPGIKPVVVACNLSSSPAQFSLGPAIKQMGLHGVFLRTLLRSDNGMGGQDAEAVTVPAFSVYIGELRR